MASQKERVLALLKSAGSFGVRSDTYLAEYIPRAAARIKELREDGYEITSEREKQFVRYTLAGSGADRPDGGTVIAPSSPVAMPNVSTRSSDEAGQSAGKRDSGRLDTSPAAGTRSVPSMFDLDSDWGDAA